MLDELHDILIARLTADLAGVGTCDAYPQISRRVTLPAVLLELDELEPEDYGSEAGFEGNARFTAYCVYDPTASNAERQVRNLAVTVAARVSQEEFFGAPEVVRAAEVLRVGADSFKPELDGYLVWAVDFQLGVSLGETLWQANPADGVSVVDLTLGDLDHLHTQHQLADGQEPSAGDDIHLPDQPKG